MNPPSSFRWLPPKAGPARWIVSERKGTWAAALRREPEASGTRIHQTRSLAEFWEMLQGAPASFVVAELTAANAEALVDRLARLPREHPLARVAVVAERSLAPYEPWVREAGAVAFLTSPRGLAPLAAMARRHLQQAPAPERGLAEQIWAGLPWGKEEG
jgi:DNA-binding LytR/AlgR family response regulator